MTLRITSIRDLQLELNVRSPRAEPRAVIKFNDGTHAFHIWVERQEGQPWRTVGWLYKKPLVRGQHDNGNVRQLDPQNASNAPVLAWIVQQPAVDLAGLDARIAAKVAELEAEEARVTAERLDRECANIRRVILALADKCHDQSAEDLRAFHANALDTEVLALRTALMNMEA